MSLPGERLMRCLRGILVAVVPVIAASAQAQPKSTSPARFDGKWSVEFTCPKASDGAKGYSWGFPAEVRGGVFRGEYRPGQSTGSLVVTGPINPDGSALLTGNGTVAESSYAIGRPNPGQPFSVRVQAQFDGSSGSGTRLGTRPCTMSMRKVGS